MGDSMDSMEKAAGETMDSMEKAVGENMASMEKAMGDNMEKAMDDSMKAATHEAGELTDELRGDLEKISGEASEAAGAAGESAADALGTVTAGAANAFPIVTTGPAAVGAIAPEFTLRDQSGAAHKLSDFRGTPVVLEWFNHGCPFVRKHYGTQNMQGLQTRYTEAGVTWLTICSSAEGQQGYTAQADLAEVVEQHGIASTALMADPDGTVGRLYDARNTPQMFVVDAAGLLVYSGAIDDNSSSSPSTVEGAHNYVAEVLDALIAGETVEPRETQPYGCSVKY